MIFVSTPSEYSRYGTYLPECQVTPFVSTNSGVNVGGISIQSSTNRAIRVTGIYLNGTAYSFPQPVEIINRDVYGLAGVYPNVSESVGKAVRDLYSSVFSMSEKPFLFTVGWNPNANENYTAHIIDNSAITGHNNNVAYMIYQYKGNNGVWGANTGPTYNGYGTDTPTINSDVDPIMRCALKNLKNIQIKSLYTTNPDIILEGIADNPTNLTIKFTYLEHLSTAFIDQLLYPLTQKNPAVNGQFLKIGNLNLSPSTRTTLENLNWTFLF